MKPLREVPPPQPDKPVVQAVSAVKITLGAKRYKIDIKVTAKELLPKPAPVIPIRPLAAPEE
jgi:hypothetical protein